MSEILYSLIMLRSIFWKPYSHLLIVGDSAGWSIDEDAKVMLQAAEKSGVKAEIVKRVRFNIPQVVHYNSQFALRNTKIFKEKHRISVDYYHGKPDQQESFKECFEALKKHHENIGAVRVSTKEMESLIKSSGINQEKVMRIPIGIDTKIFSPQTEEKKRTMRDKLNIPHDALVIGSFQKDGVGWGDGNEPKLIKGPDIFLEVVSKLKKELPNLWVLLSGPARGYIKGGLNKLGIPYRHEYLKDASELTNLYDAIDLYIVTSREEGGPKAVLESLSKGIPLVTTAVGQAKDLIRSGENAMMVAIDDIEGLYRASLEALEKKESLREKGFITARENSHESQLPLWKEYFKRLGIS